MLIFKTPEPPAACEVTLALTLQEREVLGELLRVGPYNGPDDAVRAALYHLAEFMGLDVPVNTFRLGRKSSWT